MGAAAASTRTRLSVVMGASIALHAAVLAVLALQKAPVGRVVAPTLVEVTIAPLYLVESEPQKRRARHGIRPRAPKPSTAPLPLPPLHSAPAAPTPSPGVVGEPAGARLSADGRALLSEALRRGGVGCPQAERAGLSARERAACDERLGAGAKAAAYLGQGLDAGKQKTLDLAAARKEAYRKYRDAPIPPGLSTSNAAGGLTGLGETPAVSQTPR